MMTLGEKLRAIRTAFGLTQEQLAEIMHVSRQAVTKWEGDGGLPDIANLQELARVLGLTVDHLLNDDRHLPALTMRIELDRDRYGSKLSSYSQILKDYFPEPWELFTLSVSKKMGKLEAVLDLATTGDYLLIKNASDLSPYYLAKKEQLKLLVYIKDFVLEVQELPAGADEKKFTVGNNKFRRTGKLHLK